MSDEQPFVDNELRITCADAIELMTDYLDDALSAADLDDFQTHLGLCEGCQAYLDQIDKTITLVSGTKETTVSVLPNDFDALLDAFDARRADPGQFWGRGCNT